jgi:RHS repeat-associated protein
MDSCRFIRGIIAAGLWLALLSSGPAYAATGTVTITGPVASGALSTTSNFTVTGTYVLTSDDTPTGSSSSIPQCIGPYSTGAGTFYPTYWDTTQWVGTYAEFWYAIDGGTGHQITSLTYTTVQSDLNQVKSFSMPVSVQGMALGSTHTIKFYMVDVYGILCSGSVDQGMYLGNTFASATLTFTIGTPVQKSLGGSDNIKNGPSCPLIKAQKTSDPIYLATGDEEQTAHDFTIGSGPMALSMTRSYHSLSDHDGRMGYGWTWSYGWDLKQPTAAEVTIRRADGKQMVFVDDGTGTGTFTRQSEMTDETVVKTASGWRYTGHDRSYADFDASGRLTALYAEDGQADTVAYDASGNPVSVTGPHGRTLTIAVDANGRIATITGPLARVWTYAYDASGNLASVGYPDGTTRQYLYEDTTHTHDLTGIVDEAGRRYATFQYDTQNRATLESNPATGSSDSVAYNANNTVTVTEPDGATRTYTVATVNGIPVVDSVSDPSCSCGSANNFTLDGTTGLLTTSQDLAGTTTNYTYDANGRLLSETQGAGTPLQRTLSYSYDAAGHMTSATDAMGNVTGYAYDAQGHKISETDALGHVTQWVYNSDGTLASRTAPDGGVTAYAYDANGDVVSVTYPDGSVRSMTYDAAGRLISSTDAMNNTTSYTYDARDRLLSTTYADGSKVTNTYDAAGDLASTTDAAGLVTAYTFDAEHRPLTVTRPDGTVLRMGYDGKGNLLSREVVNAQGTVVESDAMTYDADNHLLSTTHADGSQVTDTYDEVGDLLTVTDEAGRVTTNAYDAFGRLTATTDPNNETVSYAYDALDRRTSVTAANGVVTGFTYDALGEVTQETSPDRGTTAYTYGPTGDVASKTDGNGVVSNYTYDAMHRLTGIGYPSETTLDVTLAYDADGRLTHMTDAGGATAYAYDVMGRTTQADWTPAGAAFSLNLGYAYDVAGRVASVTYPSGHSVSYTYGADGRLTDMTGHWLQPNGNTRVMPLLSGVQYNALGEVVSRTLGNGIVETRSYDNRGRLTAIDAGSVLSRTLSWSPQSTITTIVDGVNASASQSFGYDAADRLTSATGSYGTLAYTYDANGNRMSRTDSTGTEPYAYAAGTNRLLTAQWLNGSTKRFAYDAAGNQVQRGGKLFAYGADNRLASVTNQADGSPVGAYVYNGRGERVKRTVYPAANPAKTTLYVYDLSGNLIGDYDDQGKLNSEYVYGPTGRLATLKPWYGNTKWQMNDHLGTPQALTDVNGTVVWTMSQTPFGRATVNMDPDGNGKNVYNNFRFPGQYWDWETQTNYNYYRSYDPAIGRYTQSDPMGIQGGINAYAYVDGNPISKTDLLGLATYMCKRRLNHVPFIFGPFFHQYICTGNAKDGYSCGGLGPTGNPFDSPSKIEHDDYKADKCEKKDDNNQCIEQCVENRLNGPLPNYSFDLSHGDNCQTFANDVVPVCEAKCRARRK